jgi:hypothetical protein
LEQIDHHMIELDDGSKPMDRVQVGLRQSVGCTCSSLQIVASL